MGEDAPTTANPVAEALDELTRRQAAGDWYPPCGTLVSLASWSTRTPTGGETLAAVAHCGATRYELHTSEDPGQARCYKDEHSQSFVDPVTGQARGELAEPGEWIDWVLRDCVPDSPSTEPLWAQDTLEAQIYRAEHHVVAYEDFLIDLTGAQSTSDVAEWMAPALQHTPAQISVHAVQGPIPTGSLFLQRHRFLAGEHAAAPGDVGFFPLPLTVPDQLWFGQAPLTHSRLSPCLDMEHDGHRIHAYEAGLCTRFSELAEHMVPELAPESWVALRVGETDTALVLPVALSWLHIHVDADGARISLIVKEAQQARAEADRLEQHRRKWGAWHDPAKFFDASQVDDAVACLLASQVAP